MVIFPIMSSSRYQKSKKKKRKKIFSRTFSSSVFLFPVIKRVEKVSGFFFSVRGEGKCEINYKKKKNFFFSFRELFHYFWLLVCRKR